MTTKKLIEQLDSIVPKKPKSDWTKYQRHIVDESIKALEQESVLDKIRAEIKALTDGAEPEHIWNVDVLNIIDKYREEIGG